MRVSKACLLSLCFVSIAAADDLQLPQAKADPLTDPVPALHKGAWNVGISGGGGVGVKIFGGRLEHDFALGNVHAGRILSDVVFPEHWWRGNLELRGEVFGGEQLDPERYVVGGGPSLRYHIRTGTRLVPFVQAGAGLTATDIKEPDLSTTFEFNLMVGGGVTYFFTEHFSAGLDYRLFHLSNAGIHRPNAGVNAHVIMADLSWWF